MYSPRARRGSDRRVDEEVARGDDAAEEGCRSRRAFPRNGARQVEPHVQRSRTYVYKRNRVDILLRHAGEDREQ